MHYQLRLCELTGSYHCIDKHVKGYIIIKKSKYLKRDYLIKCEKFKCSKLYF